jgi:hypothetical protein
MLFIALFVLLQPCFGPKKKEFVYVSELAVVLSINSSL